MNTTNYLTGAGFALIAIVFYFWLTVAIYKAIDQTSWSADKKIKIKLRFLFVVVGWGAIVSIASLSGYASNFALFPLNVLPFLLAPLVLIFWAAFSRNTHDVLANIQPKALVQMQVFRIPVELLLWACYLQGLAPIQMTLEGRNWDILSGIFGLLVGWLFYKNKYAVLVYNTAGLILLLNIVGTALLSMPTPFRVFMNEPANTFVLKFPFVFLPTFLVPLAYGLHVLSLRQTWLKAGRTGNLKN